MKIDPRDLIRYEIESPMANRRAFEKKLIGALRHSLNFLGEATIDVAADEELSSKFTKQDIQDGIDDYLDFASIIWALCMPSDTIGNEYLFAATSIEQIIAAWRARDQAFAARSGRQQQNHSPVGMAVSSGHRGRRPSVLPDAIARMNDEIAAGTITPEGLAKLSGKEAEYRFKVSRDTAVRARKAVLAAKNEPSADAPDELR